MPVPRPPLRRLASSCLAVFPAVRMPLPQIIWLVGLFLTPNAHCNHHAHEAEHACGSHSCHEDKGGCAGSCH